ncbi:hypothetical protein EDB85DRAFT_1986392 [Lactarius pseudohatsudake]|nr:hypothetical protein EDB85DRAFT_1986392 [Lactarius pseudohatsudake]
MVGMRVTLSMPRPILWCVVIWEHPSSPIRGPECPSDVLHPVCAKCQVQKAAHICTVLTFHVNAIWGFSTVTCTERNEEMETV